jgi:hypothetical protein
MNSGKLVLAIVVALCVGVPAFADGVVDDAIKLTQQGLGEEVLVAWAEHQQVGNLSAAEIIHLKEANVPARAIAALIRAGAMSQAPNMPAFAQQQQVPPQNEQFAQPNTVYSSAAPDTTNYVPASSGVYYDSYPASYGYGYGYGYPYSYGGYYYPWWYGPGFGLSFGWGGYGGWGGRGGYGGHGYGGYGGHGYGGHGYSGSGVGVGVGVGFSGSRTSGSRGY